ncbi:PREDICTED: uncharacterized protein At4g10930 isoform X2 [Nelumbo nucifera]|uniref:Uncharacterized protein At4g10930 isoform X2 n=1 Tax=Nelumbo nucifera TaxID=4432 RepID=A0A1U8AK09_NELNU|nr:PREDICTED: uncharacterized protein At4g10930 isoform X2 [Nelumbo nucifera]
MMELEGNTSGIAEEAFFEVGDDIDAAAFQNEKCGICMDVIIDRGVLDCCQHWFCFECIDNWATITNLCPLCQNEFQLITCIPVYDTIGTNKLEDPFPREDDWCIQGKNNTLSFPSYYIDENAVTCLDGDSCKIRSGLATIKEDSNLDTSIACDSCDIWYHAFCVGFVPEGVSESSWLCPRCVIDEVPKKSDVISVQRPNNQCDPDIVQEHPVDAMFSGKVSVSVADTGETAVVVSMVGEMQLDGGSSEDFLSLLEINKDPKIETLLINSNASSPKLEAQLKESTSIQTNVGAEETSLALSLTQNPSFTLSDNSSVLSQFDTKNVDNEICEPNGHSECETSSHLLYAKSFFKIEPSGTESDIDLHLGLSFGSSLSVDKVDDANIVAGDVQQHNSLEESSLSVDRVDVDPNDNVGVDGVTSLKRKFTSSRDDAQIGDHTECEDRETSDKIKTKVSTKKARSEGEHQEIPKCQASDSVQDETKKCSSPIAVCENNKLHDHLDKEVSPSTKKARSEREGEHQEIQASDSVQNDSQKCSSLLAVCENNKLQGHLDKEVAPSDIMSIVQETDYRSSRRPTHPHPTDNSSKERDNAVGLRVKKIMRRASDDKESAVLVQKLREEIREAVRNKSSKDFGKNNIFDPKLLAAFRAAIAGPKTEPVKQLNTFLVKSKKSLLQKGKVRENLTKKIYGTSNGRRRRAWDRDWEIEFWKHRCMRTTKPEKVETLKSVLDLLRKSSEMEKGSEGEASNPILSRLYLADTSVFPRKDDIKPLSALTCISNNEQIKEDSSTTKNFKPKFDNHTVQTPSMTAIPSVDKGKKGGAPSLKCESNSSKIHPNGPTSRLNSISLSGGSKVKSQDTKDTASKSDNVKIDKRKWALEVLARKTAMGGKDAAQMKQEDIAVLKGNYPLLAQLPIDMRPVLAPIRHNKVPVSVRQAQLYRLTEHFLRIANLPIICRTAVTELAIADAVNIEKEIADRSNSKLVYVNLCSQVLSQHRNNSKPGSEAKELNPPSEDIARSTEPAAAKESSFDPTVEEALRLAGLLSESPPNSPYCPMKEQDDEEDTSLKVQEEDGPVDIFNMDSHPELDIYGDFEYDLEEEDYISATSLRAPKSQPQEGDSKMKVVFSTLNSERENNGLDFKDNGRLRVAEESMDSPMLECHKDSDIQSSNSTDKVGRQSLPLESLQDGDAEPSMAECEELYGPDKEPLVERFPINASREPDKLVQKEASSEEIAPAENKTCGSNKASIPNHENENSTENISVTGRFSVEHDSSVGNNSPKHSLTRETVLRKETSPKNHKQLDLSHSISIKVEAYIKEHIRPLCKSGVITVDQYRWAVAKTTDKVMKYHVKAKNANFLIKEGEKVKKLAEQYVKAAKDKQE